ncbi:MAG: hypothetical protein WCW66_04500 [Patescibacteria group bacterium]|jgi:hypothetical protein
MFKVPQPYFEGAPTTAEERRVLQCAGYIHMTGLWFLTPDRGHGVHVNYMGQGIVQEEMGTWNEFDGQSVIVTKRGEVWMKTGSSVTSATALLCPNGRSDYKPFTQTDRPIDGMIRRIADPNDGLTYVP